MIPKTPKVNVEEIKSPSTYDVKIAYVPSKNPAYNPTKFSPGNEYVQLHDGTLVLFNGIDIKVLDNSRNNRDVAVVSEMLNPDKSLDDHEQGVSYKVISTNPKSLRKKIENGAYSRLYALKNGNSAAGYSPLENLTMILQPVERVANINKLANDHGLFEVAYAITGGCWRAQRREALESQLLKAGMNIGNVKSALDVYDGFLEVSSAFEGYSMVSLIANPGKLRDYLKKQADGNIAFLIYNEKMMSGDAEQAPLKIVYEKLKEMGLEEHTARYRSINERVEAAKKAINLNKRKYRDLADIIKSTASDDEKVNKILEAASHDIRLHEEYLNPFENFYIIAPPQLGVDKIAALTEAEFNEASSRGVYNDLQKSIFKALQAIRKAGGMKVIKHVQDEFTSHDDKETHEGNLTLMGQRRHDAKRILEIFYEETGLEPDKFPIYVVGVSNPHFTMDDVEGMKQCLDEHYVDKELEKKARQLKGREIDVPSENVLTRIKLHTMWDLEKYNRLCKDLVAKAIDYAKDKTFGYREQIWFRHYGDAIKDYFPQILYRFMEQLVLEDSKKETGGAPLLEHIVEIYGGILYHGLGMDRQGAHEGKKISRRMNFTEAYIAAKFCLDPKLVGDKSVNDEFERNVLSEDAKWLDELYDRGIATKLDELLFKYLHPDVAGLSKDVKTLINDMKNVDTIGTVLTRMNASWSLCSEDEFIEFYKAKEQIDAIDPELFPDILPFVIAFSRNRGELATDWENYMADVYQKMKEVIKRYPYDSEEIISAVENELKMLEKIKGFMRDIKGEMDIASLGKIVSEQAAMPKEDSEMTLSRLLHDLAAKMVMGTPELRAWYIYNEIEKEVDKMERPKEEAADINIEEGDFL